MIDSRFSSASFAQLGLDTDEARELADLLQDEVTLELQNALEPHFIEIITRLNSLGHDLKPYEHQLGSINFRDDSEDGEGYRCKLRLAFDLVVSAGYADTISSEEAWEQTMRGE